MPEATDEPLDPLDCFIQASQLANAAAGFAENQDFTNGIRSLAMAVSYLGIGLAEKERGR